MALTSAQIQQMFAQNFAPIANANQGELTVAEGNFRDQRARDNFLAEQQIREAAQIEQENRRTARDKENYEAFLDLQDEVDALNDQYGEAISLTPKEMNSLAGQAANEILKDDGFLWMFNSKPGKVKDLAGDYRKIQDIKDPTQRAAVDAQFQAMAQAAATQKSQTAGKSIGLELSRKSQLLLSLSRNTRAFPDVARQHYGGGGSGGGGGGSSRTGSIRGTAKVREGAGGSAATGGTGEGTIADGIAAALEDTPGEGDTPPPEEVAAAEEAVASAVQAGVPFPEVKQYLKDLAADMGVPPPSDAALDFAVQAIAGLDAGEIGAGFMRFPNAAVTMGKAAIDSLDRLNPFGRAIRKRFVEPAFNSAAEQVGSAVTGAIDPTMNFLRSAGRSIEGGVNNLMQIPAADVQALLATLQPAARPEGVPSVADNFMMSAPPSAYDVAAQAAQRGASATGEALTPAYEAIRNFAVDAYNQPGYRDNYGHAPAEPINIGAPVENAVSQFLRKIYDPTPRQQISGSPFRTAEEVDQRDLRMAEQLKLLDQAEAIRAASNFGMSRR